MFKTDKEVESIDIRKLKGDVDIVTHDENELWIETTNEEKIEFTLANNILYIESKDDEDKKNNKKKSKFNFFNRNSNNIVINGNGNIIISGDDQEPIEVKMSIRVPKNAIREVCVSGRINIKIGNISSVLDIDSSGQVRTQVHDIKMLNVDASGQSHILINECLSLDVDLSGQSSLTLESSKIDKTIIDLSGQSRMDIECELIEYLGADISGQSEIVTKGKINKKEIDKSGQSRFIEK